MLYKFTLFYYRGHCTEILKDISIVNGNVYGTRVGTLKFDATGELAFTACEPSKYISGGGAFTLVEFKGELKKG